MIVLLAFPRATNATPTGIRKPAPPNILRPHVYKKCYMQFSLIFPNNDVFKTWILSSF